MKAIELGFRQRVRAGVFGRVLSRDHEEGARQWMQLPVDRDASLGHRLQQRRLGLRAGSIDLVGQDNVGEQGSAVKDEISGRASLHDFGHRRANHIAGQKVTGKLDASKSAVDAASKGRGQSGLADARDILQQEVAPSNQGLHGARHDLGFSAKGSLAVAAQGVGQLRGPDGCERGGHRGGRRRGCGELGQRRPQGCSAIFGRPKARTECFAAEGDAASARTRALSWVSLRLEGGKGDQFSRALVAACEAGASGGEETEGSVPALVLYAPADQAEAVASAVRAAVPELTQSLPEPVEEVAWSEAWKEGLQPLAIGDRLIVRPSFWEEPLPDGPEVLTIDPGQAFGTGGHTSTRLVLELLCDLPPEALHGAEVLDVGCGTAVLALGALRLGASMAVALDLDPLAVEAAALNAEVNGLSSRLEVFHGPLEVAPEGRFGLILANMIRSELFPVLPAIRRRCQENAVVILSGLLREEEAPTKALLEELGLEVQVTKDFEDDLGDHWLALTARPSVSRD